MKHSINKEWLTAPTGDPFADVGGYVIEYFMEKWPELSIMDLIKKATYIYVKNWDNNLHSFFLNSTITHNSNKGQKGIDNTLKYYQSLLDDDNATEGYCRITGQKGKVFPGARENHIMSGSATLINFHHGFESGIMLSKEALIRMFFVPLGVEQLGDKVALIASNKEEVTRFFVKQNVELNLHYLGIGQSKAILKSEFFNPANALFNYAHQCIENIRSLKDTLQIRQILINLFHFTNFGAKPTINLYTLPATVFYFYAYCITKHKKEWKNFVYYNYWSSKFKNASFNETNERWQNTKEEVDFDIFRVWRNTVFDNLISGKSILKQILKYVKNHPFCFDIVEIYQINIMNMDKKTVDKIKTLAVFIVEGRSEKDIEKLVTKLNGTKRSSDLRSFLIKLQAENYKKENKEPLFSLEEYVYYLFPDGTYWFEIRDLLLIAVYEKLHEENKRVDVELAETEEEQN